MPTADRKPRRRKATERTVEPLPALLENARRAKPADWDAGLRRSLVRALIGKGHSSDEAEGIARAYERRPSLIPMAPPPVRVIEEGKP